MATLLNEEQWSATAKICCDTCADKDGCEQVKYDCPKMCFKTLTHDAQGYLGEAKTVEDVRKIYPKGARVELVKMEDPHTKLNASDKGTVEFIDDACGIHIRWDNGEGLAAIFGVDIIKVVEGGDND